MPKCRRSRRLTKLLAYAAAITAVSATDLAQIGKWEMKTENSGVVAVHMALLPHNRLVLTERFHEPAGDGGDPEARQKIMSSGFYAPNKNLGEFLTDTAEYDLNTNRYKMIDYLPVDEVQGQNEGYAFCAGAAQMADGNVVMVGGDQKWFMEFKGRNYTSDGRRDVRVYRNGKFHKVASLPTQWINGMESKLYSGRWYPSVLTLPNEDILIIGGHHIYYSPDDPLANNPTYEIFHPSTNSLSTPVTVPMLIETYPVNMYPIVHVLPKSGRVWALAGHESVVIDTHNGNQVNSTSLPKNDLIMGRSFPFAPGHWLNPLSKESDYNAVAWICGGTNSTGPDGNPVPREGEREGKPVHWWSNCPDCPATARCYSLEIEKEGARWVAEDMPLARSQSTAVNLPDGTIAIIGGSGKGHQGGNAGNPYNFDPVNTVVIFDPAQKIGSPRRWRQGAAATVARQYHHTALLLADGTIVTGGDDEQNYIDRFGVDPYSLKLEIYHPPYMFIADRPHFALDKIPTHLSYHKTLTLHFTTAVAPKIRTVSLIRFSTVTHSTNFDQRQVILEVLKYSRDKILVRTPPDSKIAPPGNYMLWAVDGRGAPVVKAAEINLREGNKMEDASGWNEEDTVEPEWTEMEPKEESKSGTSAGEVGSVVSGWMVLVGVFIGLVGVGVSL